MAPSPLLKGLRDGCLGRDLPMAERFRLARLGGFEGLELTLEPEGPYSLHASDAELAELAVLAADGMPLLCLNAGSPWQASPSASDRDERERGLDLCRRSIDIAARLGVDTLLYIAGKVTPTDGFSYVWDAARAATEQLLPQAEQAGVVLAVENVWNNLILSPRDMLEFVDQFDSPFVRVYFDVGNVLAFGYPQHWIEALGGERIARVHVKDFNTMPGGRHGFTQLLHGDVDWPVTMAALRQVGYQGWITPEVPPYGHFHEAWIHELSAAMDTIIGYYDA
jgi:hexulose-6-phosphate isomerase